MDPHSVAFAALILAMLSLCRTTALIRRRQFIERRLANR